MINILPQPKKVLEYGEYTSQFNCLRIVSEQNVEEIVDLCKLRFWN